MVPLGCDADLPDRGLPVPQDRCSGYVHAGDLGQGRIAPRVDAPEPRLHAGYGDQGSSRHPRPSGAVVDGVGIEMRKKKNPDSLSLLLFLFLLLFIILILLLVILVFLHVHLLQY